MSDFLAENNLCGQNLLRIVSKGNAILAQLFKLKDNIPSVYRLESKADIAKYGDLILDLKYFTQSEIYEKKIDEKIELKELDDELRETYSEVLTEFYSLFESILKYVLELNKFVEDVKDGVYIQMTWESILWDIEGKQLLVELLYLYGVMLILIEKHIPGIIRERMLTSFYRYSSSQLQSDTNVDDVCKLLRSTKRTPSYPQDYFSRIPVDPIFVNMLIGRLRSDDVYNQLSSYPLPDHRSTALGTQAAILVILLNFSPKILTNETAMMREICDKFFHDNWVVPIYTGYRVNLIEIWDGFRAAKAALEISKTCQIDRNRINLLIAEVWENLKEGVLVEDNILERAQKIISLLRECNVALRWTILHTGPLDQETVTKRSKQVRDQVILETKFDVQTTLNLLLHVSQLELKVRELFKKLLQEKEIRWVEGQNEAKVRIEELAEVFSGAKPLTRIEKNEALHGWLLKKAQKIQSLSFENLVHSGRQIIELIRAFNDMLEYHNLESQIQVKEWVNQTTSCLHKMLRTGSINEDTLVTLQIIGDLGYAWGPLIDNFTSKMQELIKKDPFAVSKLRAVFLKLSSVMDIPLMRLNQAKSSELVTVSSYYSGELVDYVQKVLQIIPESVFGLLDEIIKLQTNDVKELPTRLDKDKVKDYAQLEARHKISRLTHDMSVLAEGILMMKTTLFGIIQIDPKVLLERGIRKELLRQLSSVMVSAFGAVSSKMSLELRLSLISQRVDGIRRSFEYIGDYVNCHGLKIFQEEMNRFIHFATEQESNKYKKTKVLDFMSKYQNKEVPIMLPVSEDHNFIGKLATEILGLTEPKLSIYISDTRSWYDLKTHASLVTPETFKLLENSVDIVGLVGLDRLFSLNCVKELEGIFKVIRGEVSANLEFLTSLNTGMEPPFKIHPFTEFNLWASKTSRSKISGMILKIGQLLLLRKSIKYQLKISACINAKELYQNLDVVNNLASLSLQIDHDESVEEFAYEISKISASFGMNDPIAKIYTTLRPIQYLPLLLSLITIQQLKKMIFSKKLASLISRKTSENIDGMPFIIGLNSVLAQVHSEQYTIYLSFICQYLNSYRVHMASPSFSITRKDEELGTIYFFIVHLIRHSSKREEHEKLVKMIVPCFTLLPTLINLIS